MSDELGTIRNHGYDGSRHERLERLEAVVECPRCRAKIECWSDTESWIETSDDRWQHDSYGPAQGVCETCSLLFVYSFEGAKCYQLSRKKG